MVNWRKINYAIQYKTWMLLCPVNSNSSRRQRISIGKIILGITKQPRIKIYLSIVDSQIA